MNDSVEIRPLRLDDAPQVQRNCFPNLPEDEVRERAIDDIALLSSGMGMTLVAVEAGRLGVHAKLLKREDCGWIFDVAAHANFRGRGIVQEVLEALAGHARKMGLKRLCIHVREDNIAARRAYEKAGFRRAGQDGMHGAQLRYERSLDQCP